MTPSNRYLIVAAFSLAVLFAALSWRVYAFSECRAVGHGMLFCLVREGG